VGWGDVSPSRPAKPAAPHVTSACRAAAAPWGLLRAKKLLGTGAYRSGVDQGSTAPVRTLALASFSLLTFLSSFFLSSFLASLESPFLEESLESLESFLALSSFFASFVAAFSSCVRRACDGARAARGAVDANEAARRRHRREQRESKTPQAHLLLLLLLGPGFFRPVVLVGAFLLEVAALRVQG
jgi:hypothetical protein